MPLSAAGRASAQRRLLRLLTARLRLQVSLASLTCHGVRNCFDAPDPQRVGHAMAAAVERLPNAIVRE